MDAGVRRVFDACGDEADDVLVDYLVSSIGGIDLSDPAASTEVGELLEAHVDSFGALTYVYRVHIYPVTCAYRVPKSVRTAAFFFVSLAALTIELDS